ncbi:WD40 repeat domain-containing protein [Nocardioides ferulae]|uniref:WD40 repeat domain-containing protein n=1 Tax=Nocardioides ferulae TaxID=2340821 RepID=UPI000EB22CF0|nr:hypothetical protein [Nocardioides ferulae]
MDFSRKHARLSRALLGLLVAGSLATTQLAVAADGAPSADAAVGTGALAPAGARGGEDLTLSDIGQVRLPETTTGVRDLAVSADGKRAVAVGGDWLQVLRLTSGDPVITAQSTAVFGGRVVLAKDGRTAYVLEDTDQLFVVDLRKNRAKKVATLRRYRLAPSDVFDIEISPNGRFLLAKYGYEIGGFGDGSGIQVFSLAKPRKPRKISRVKALEWHGRVDVAPNNRLVVTSSSSVDDYLMVYRLNRKGRMTKLKRIPVQFSPEAIAFNRASTRAFVQSFSSEDPMRIAEVNLKKRRLVRVKRVDGFEGGTDVVVSPDGDHLFATMWRSSPADNPSFVTLDATTLEPLHASQGEELYGPQAVQSPSRGPAAGRILVPTYTGFTGGRPLVIVYSYE